VRLRIGTRRSRLALAQAEEVAAALREAGHETELVPMTTAGDRGASADRSPAGVKGLFVAEITDAVLRGGVDLAVHSAKDLPSEDPEGLIVAAVPRRSLPYDVLVTRGEEPGEGARVGTSSLRRRAQLLVRRPRVLVEDLRGNVDTRLRRLEEGAFDALILAAAGLARLHLRPEHVLPIPVDEMVPAPGQGALAVHAREDDPAAEAAAAIDHAASRRTFLAERLLVARLGGGCRLPLGAYAEAREGVVRLLAIVVRPDGTDLLRSEIEAPTPEEAAEWAADRLLAAGAARILDEVR
jgi:hydroxymethylbilane synthase